MFRQAAVEALGRVGEPAVEPLIAALRDVDYDVRNAVREALGMVDDPRVGESPIAALQDENEVARFAANLVALYASPIKDPRVILCPVSPGILFIETTLRQQHPMLAPS
jgi:HEAT repeat protein